jgi:hypothetical protein
VRGETRRERREEEGRKNVIARKIDRWEGKTRGERNERESKT